MSVFGGHKALSWPNLLFEMSAYVQRNYMGQLKGGTYQGTELLCGWLRFAQASDSEPGHK